MDAITALGDLIRSERAALVQLARREGLGAEDAVECVQEAFSTFLQILQRGDAPPASAEWPAYVAAVARNAARNRRRRHHLARPHAPMDGEEPASAETAEDLLAAAEEHVRLRACVEQLCETQRAVVMLRLLEEQSGEDVAAVLGITRGYVDVLLHRARASLRECMMD